MNVLKKTEFGNPILRERAHQIAREDISSPKLQSLIRDMRHTLLHEKLGVGLAAPQIGKSLALAVMAIRPTKHRPKVQEFDLVLINPVIVEVFGRRRQMWEGCLSAGVSGLFAKVPRYNKVAIKYMDEHGKVHKRQFEGLKAQVIQHEIDHLNGVLFVDHVKDTKSYMTLKEYKKHVAKKKK